MDGKTHTRRPRNNQLLERRLSAAARAAVEALEGRRLLSVAGDPDLSFGSSDGAATVAGVTGVTSLDTRGGSTVVAAGSTLVRLNSAGKPDNGFDADGRRDLNNFARIEDVFIQADGKV